MAHHGGLGFHHSITRVLDLLHVHESSALAISRQICQNTRGKVGIGVMHILDDAEKSFQTPAADLDLVGLTSRHIKQGVETLDVDLVCAVIFL